MATKTFYWLPDAAAGTSAHGSLQDGGSAPVAADSNSQFKVGTVAAGNYAKYARNTQRQPADFNTTVQPDGNIDNVHGDCLRTQNAYTGYFAGANWTINFGLRPTTAHVGTTATLRARIFRSTDPGGLNATELTASPLVTANFDGSMAIAQTLAVTWSPGAFALRNEYLFIELALDITGAGNSATYTWIIQTGNAISTILTPDFTDDPATYLDQRAHKTKKIRYRKKRGPKKRSRWEPPNGIVVVQPYPFWNRKKKWPKKKPPKKKRRDRLEYIAITIATLPPGFPFSARKKVKRQWPKNRKRLKQWRSFPFPYKQLASALCGHGAILSMISATARIIERDTAKGSLLPNMSAAAKTLESRAGKTLILESLMATATLICCK
jgi:hypothetical protein